jgi:hypothetical protein
LGFFVSEIKQIKEIKQSSQATNFLNCETQCIIMQWLWQVPAKICHGPRARATQAEPFRCIEFIVNNSSSA